MVLLSTLKFRGPHRRLDAHLKEATPELILRNQNGRGGRQICPSSPWLKNPIPPPIKDLVKIKCIYNFAGCHVSGVLTGVEQSRPCLKDKDYSTLTLMSLSKFLSSLLSWGMSWLSLQTSSYKWKAKQKQVLSGLHFSRIPHPPQSGSTPRLTSCPFSLAWSEIAIFSFQGPCPPLCKIHKVKETKKCRLLKRKDPPGEGRTLSRGNSLARRKGRWDRKDLYLGDACLASSRITSST